MPQNTPHHSRRNQKRLEHNNVDMNATCLGTNLNDTQGLDERADRSEEKEKRGGRKRRFDANPATATENNENEN